MKTAGVVLAAGRSQRFGGGNKLLAMLGGGAVAGHVAAAMRKATLTHRAVVTADADVAGLFDGFVVLEPDAGADQSSSLRAGAAWALDVGADRLLVALADMPLVDAALLDRVLDRCTDDRPSIAAAEDRRAPPACFPRGMLVALTELNGDSGARDILGKLPEDAVVPTSVRSLADIDTGVDLRRLAKAMKVDARMPG